MNDEEKAWVKEQIAAAAQVDQVTTMLIAEILHLKEIIPLQEFCDRLRLQIDAMNLDRSQLIYRRLERLLFGLEELNEERSRQSPPKFPQ
ncbi:hypothetical protein GCM10007874_11570 [Labrys miyagiensis]|uniref:Uncharacterized protein n=1 Tax=Labrys miyagiensis TaxID=346912 RepID=A0ABQ6CIT5_9HYPH|nr:hypothetical protein [Labrys miyagiensis]GLS18141.1 hypothetical protein GCM10007874_11570 [Labrys miyagiensis]